MLSGVCLLTCERTVATTASLRGRVRETDVTTVESLIRSCLVTHELNQTQCSRPRNSCYRILSSKIAPVLIVLLDGIRTNGSKLSGFLDLVNLDGILAVVVKTVVVNVRS